MDVGVEHLALGLHRSDAVGFEGGQQFAVDQFDALRPGRALAGDGPSDQPAVSREERLALAVVQRPGHLGGSVAACPRVGHRQGSVNTARREEQVALLRHLLDEKTNCAFFCGDDAQNIFGQKMPNWKRNGFLFQGRSSTLELSCNFRNTQQIFDYAWEYYGGLK